MNLRIILLGIAVASMGLVVLPETLALFAGQHNFYDTTQTGIQVPCQKCHADIQTELTSSVNKVNAVHNAIGCIGCHVIGAAMEGNIAHSAGTVECMTCHNGRLTSAQAHLLRDKTNLSCMDCHNIRNGVFATSINASSIYLYTDAHRSMVVGANNSVLLKGANEACVACHTHVAVNITWKKPTTMVFEANVNNGQWSVENFTATGEKITSTSGS